MKKRILILLNFTVVVFFSLQLYAQSTPENISINRNEIVLGKLSEGVRAFAQNHKMGFMDSNDSIIQPAVFDILYEDELPFFKEGRCVYFEKDEANDSYFLGFIDNKFKKVIPAKYPVFMHQCSSVILPSFINGRAIVDKPLSKKEILNYKYLHDTYKKYYIIIDQWGNQIGKSFNYPCDCIPGCQLYPEISEGLIAAGNKKGKMGYIDPVSGKTAISFKYTLAGPFSEGLSVVEIDNQYVVIIDKKGNKKIDKKYYKINFNNQQSNIYDLEAMLQGCRHPGGFVNGKLILNYFDKDGYGELIYTLIDNQGNIIISKKPTDSQQIDISEDEDFNKYEWKSSNQ
jgi:hypothetical protein